MCCTMSEEVRDMKNTRIGEKIAEYRRKNGLTLRDFCQADQFEHSSAQPVGTEYWQSHFEYLIYTGGSYGYFCIRTG